MVKDAGGGGSVLMLCVPVAVSSAVLGVSVGRGGSMSVVVETGLCENKANGVPGG